MSIEDRLKAVLARKEAADNEARAAAQHAADEKKKAADTRATHLAAWRECEKLLRLNTILGPGEIQLAWNASTILRSRMPGSGEGAIAAGGVSLKQGNGPGFSASKEMRVNVTGIGNVQLFFGSKAIKPTSTSELTIQRWKMVLTEFVEAVA